MFDITFKVIGANRFRRLANPTGAITKASWVFARKQGAIFLRQVMQEAPVGWDWEGREGGFNRPGHPGLLKKSHVLRVTNPFHVEIVNTQDYAIFVALGTRPHWPPRSSGLPFAVRRHIGLHGTQANPWMERAFMAAVQTVDGNLQTLGDQVAQELGGGGSK